MPPRGELGTIRARAERGKSLERVDVHGLTIAFERRGEGSPLLLLHGGLSDHREWRRQLDAFSDEFTVVAWDCPGCGASSDPPDSFRLTEYAACLAGFIEQVGLDRPHVVGLSWGSVLALTLFERAPEVPRSLVLVSAYAGWAGSLPPDQVSARLEGALRDLERAPDELIEEFLPTLFTERVSEPLLHELTAIVSEFHPVGARAMLHSIAEADLRGILPRIDVPTLLLYGEHDARSPRPIAEDLASAIRGAELVFLAGAGHQCNMEAPDLFNTAVRGFLRSR